MLFKEVIEKGRGTTAKSWHLSIISEEKKEVVVTSIKKEGWKESIEKKKNTAETLVIGKDRRRTPSKQEPSRKMLP